MKNNKFEVSKFSDKTQYKASFIVNDDGTYTMVMTKGIYVISNETRCIEALGETMQALFEADFRTN